MGRGDRAYVRGELGGIADWRLFRQATPLIDPTTKEILGYEARFVGTAAYVREGGTATVRRQGIERVHDRHHQHHAGRAGHLRNPQRQRRSRHR